jgi:predicted TIM-barrel fold metal-dependent hydrolase
MMFAEMAARRTNPPRDPLAILPRVGEGVYDPDGSQMIRDMDDLGIDVSVIQVLDWGLNYVTRGEEDSITPIAEINRLTLEVAHRNPGRVYAFAGVDPRRAGAVKLFERAVKEWGAIGYKPYTPNGYYANDPSLLPIYEKCVEFDVPVLIHCGGSGYAIPEPVEEIAVQFPDLKVILGHTNLQGRFESGTYWRAIQIASGVTNIHLDICDWQVLGILDEWNIADFWHVMDVMRNSVGAHRIVWGTDLPMRGKGYEQTRTWVEMFKNLPEESAKFGVTFTEEERDLICHQNAERLVGRGAL